MITAAATSTAAHSLTLVARRCATPIALRVAVTRALSHSLSSSRRIAATTASRPVALSTQAYAAQPSVHSRHRIALTAAAAAAAALLAAVCWRLRTAQSAAAASSTSSATTRLPGSALSSASALATGNAVYAFGSNSYSCLGLGTDDVSRSLPTRLAPAAFHGEAIRQIVASASGHVCGAVTASGLVYTWGGPTSGDALGHGSDISSSERLVSTPRVIEGLRPRKIVQLSLSETHGAALEELPDGAGHAVWVWGSRALGLPPPPLPTLPASLRGSIANPASGAAPAEAQSSAPIRLSSLDAANIIQVACGKNHTLALAADGRVFAFGGSESSGALGLGPQDSVEETARGRASGVPSSAPAAPRSLRGGSALPDAKLSHTPTLVPLTDSSLACQAIAAGEGLSLLLTKQGKLYSCGNNEYGQGGTGDGRRRILSPQLVPLRMLTSADNVNGNNDEASLVALAAGSLHALALDSAGSVYAWGWNQSGQLGLGHKQIENRVPQQIKIPAAAATSSATAAEHTAANAGGNNQKALFVAAGFETSAIITVPSSTAASSPSSSSSPSLFLCGRGREGQLGRGDQMESVAASREKMQVVTFFQKQPNTRVLQVACGQDFTLVLVKEAKR